MLGKASALVGLGAEDDLAGVGVHGFDDGEGFQLDAAGADQVAAMLEALSTAMPMPSTVAPARSARSSRPKIGRASCRERV